MSKKEEHYRVVEPLSIVMPGGCEHEYSDTTELLQHDSCPRKEDRMASNAAKQSKLLDEKLNIASKYDGTEVIETQRKGVEISNRNAVPASMGLDHKLATAHRRDILEPGLDIYGQVNYTYDGEYVNTEGPTGYQIGGYTGSDYSFKSEHEYKPEEYKSVYDR